MTTGISAEIDDPSLQARRAAQARIGDAATAAAPAFAGLRWLALGGVLALFVLKIAYAFELKVNSDEPQHLHVVWAWTAGQLPYRDLFDNHAPLFQLLWSPLLALIGERGDIVEWMRLTVLPLYLACIWLTWRIGRSLWSGEVAFAAAAIIAVYPVFFIVSTEFRPDDLWALLWLATMLFLCSGRLDARRGACAGLAAGAALAVSLKTLPLLLTAAFAAVIIALAMRRRGHPLAALPWPFLAAFAAAFLLVPAVLIGYFVANGTGSTMYYALLQHNLVADLGREEHEDLRFLVAPLTLPVALWFAWRSRPTGNLVPWARRTFVLLAASGYLVAIYGYWPLFTPQDLLPVAPFFALAVAVALLRVGTARYPARGLRRAAVAAVLLIELVVLVGGYPLWEGHRGEFARRLEKVLALTRADDYVMDAKGDSIFRRRPIYWVLEGITETRMRDGSIVDDIIERLATTATPLVQPERLPEADQQFVQANYLALDDDTLGGDISIAGQHLGAVAGGKPQSVAIAIPLEYTLISRDGPARATIDGTPCSRACKLTAGTHSLVAERDGELALVWAPALDRGVSAASLFPDAAPAQ